MTNNPHTPAADDELVERAVTVLREAYPDLFVSPLGHVVRNVICDLAAAGLLKGAEGSGEAARLLLQRIAKEARDEHDKGDGHFSTEEVELLESLVLPTPAREIDREKVRKHVLQISDFAKQMMLGQQGGSYLNAIARETDSILSLLTNTTGGRDAE